MKVKKEDKPIKKTVTKVIKSEPKDSSDSSVTLGQASPNLSVAVVETTSVIDPPLPPDPVEYKKMKKAQNEPFSRIAKDIQVDPRFASNQYYNMDYSQRAHEDLIVTRGKGFTKEKNKKKRGSFKAGRIDTHVDNSIYFDD